MGVWVEGSRKTEGRVSTEISGAENCFCKPGAGGRKSRMRVGVTTGARAYYRVNNVNKKSSFTGAPILVFLLFGNLRSSREGQHGKVEGEGIPRIFNAPLRTGFEAREEEMRGKTKALAVSKDTLIILLKKNRTPPVVLDLKQTGHPA